MKCNPIRWLWGVLPIAALALLATLWERASIEADLGQRVAERLSRSGVAWAKSDFSGRDGMIVGRASDESEPQRAADLAASVWGVRRVDSRAELIEKAETYVWSASRNGSRIVLRGMVPNDTTRRTILGLARTQFPDGDVVDEMRMTRGVPSAETWSNGVGFALKQLNGLKSGDVRLDGLGLAVTGEAASQASYRSVRNAIQSDVPRGITLRDERIIAPAVSPYVWGARYSGNDVTLTGFVPDDRVRAQVLAQARAYPRSPRVIDRMEIGSGAPAGFATSAVLSLRELARLEDGTAALRDAALSLEGLAADEQTAATARRELRANAPPGIRVTDQIRVREAPVALIQPYTGGVDVDDARVVLTGHVPSAASQSALVQSARTRFPGRQIDDRLVVGAGAPEGWQRCFDGALLGIARVGTGRAQLVDRRLDVSGRTDDDDLAAAVQSDVRVAVQGACDANTRIEVVAVAEPDRAWRAVYDGGDPSEHCASG